MPAEQDIANRILTSNIDPDGNLGKKRRQMPDTIQAYIVNGPDGQAHSFDNPRLIGLREEDRIFYYSLPDQEEIVQGCQGCECVPDAVSCRHVDWLLGCVDCEGLFEDGQALQVWGHYIGYF